MWLNKNIYIYPSQDFLNRFGNQNGIKKSVTCKDVGGFDGVSRSDLTKADQNLFCLLGLNRKKKKGIQHPKTKLWIS